MSIRWLLASLAALVGYASASCPYIRTSVILAECVFDTSRYISLGAHVSNSTSIDFIGHYALQHPNTTHQLNSNTLIYNLGHRWMLLVPLLLRCSHQPVNLTFTECQYTMRQYPSKSRASVAEYMTTQLSVMNITDLGRQSVLFLQPGDISLRSCKAYDCARELVYLTASNETFNFRINYEKPVGTKCQADSDCSNHYSVTDLLRCDPRTQTCQCFDENISTVNLPGIGRLCTDSINRSNCTKYPQRCLQWCDQSPTSSCLCPTYTRKVKKTTGVFDCELEPTGLCRFDDAVTIRKCPTGTFCNGNRCRPLPFSRRVTDDVFDSSLLLASTTLQFDSDSSTPKPLNSIPSMFFRTVIVIIIGIVLFFLLILFILGILFKSHRFRILSSSEDKASASSFVQSTLTDVSNEIFQCKPNTNIIRSYSNHYHQNYLSIQPTFIHGLVPQTNLSPRFYRHPQGTHERRAPVHIRSPSLSGPDRAKHPHPPLKSISHDQQLSVPKMTRLYNGDVLISA